MAIAIIIIPLTLVVIAGIIGYLTYRFVLYDYFCNRTVNQTLRKYDIKKTQFQIIKEFHIKKGKKISEKEISQMQKRYRQHEPEQFLAMYDSIRDESESGKLKSGKSESGKLEDSKSESGKLEDSKSESGKLEDSKSESGKLEDSKSEDSKSENGKSEDSKKD